MTDHAPLNMSFSKVAPGHQIAIDSTSLGEFKTCPRKYYYRIVQGWQKDDSPHLFFGILLHQAREIYEHLRLKGLEHEEILDKVMDYVLRVTWNKELKRPWISGHEKKNRLSLLRTVVWYLDEARDDNMKTLVTKRPGEEEARPAVELSFRFDSGFRSEVTGEVIVFCGHLDRLVQFNEDNYLADIKTTSGKLGEQFFAQFNPSNQFGMYDLASKVCFGIQVKGMIVDGVEVGATYSRFQRQLIQRPKGLTEEWLEGQGFWLKWMGDAFLAGRWPMNDKACDLYGGCQFREVCARAPGAREKWLQTNYKRQVWDPLKTRGDI